MAERRKRRRNQRQNRFASQAAMESLLRFGPEVSGLVALQRQAESDYRSSLAQARGQAESITGAIQRARPEVKAAYEQAEATRAAAAQVLGNDVSSLGPIANSIKAAVGLEQATGARGIAQAKAATVADLSSRAVQAREGAVWAQRSAKDKFVSDLERILARRQDVAREQGTFQALTARELRQQAQERADRFKIQELQLTQSERNSMRSAGIDPNTGQVIQEGPLDPDPTPTPAQRRAEQSARRAERAARERRQRTQRSGLAELENATEMWRQYSRTRVEDARGRQRLPTADEITQRMLGENFDAWQIQVARDLVRHNGYLSDAGARVVRRQGLKVPARWRRRSRAPIRTQPQNMQGYGGV